MNRISMWLPVCVALAAMQGCVKDDTDEKTARISDTLTYQCNVPGASLIKDISLKAVVSRQCILASVEMLNHTGQPVSLQPYLWELKSKNGLRSTPVSATSGKEMLEPGQSAIVTLVFKPVQEQRLFHETGLRGDPGETYDLVITLELPAGELSESVSLSADHDQYIQAVKKFGIGTAIVPYRLAASGDFIRKQNIYLEKLKMNADAKKRSVYISGNEILLKGLWMKFMACYRNDTLHVDFRLVNQSALVVQINPGRIALCQGSDCIAPVFKNGSQIADIRDGDRASFHLKFPVHPAGELSLDLKPVIFKKSMLPVFQTPLVFRPVQIPNG